MTPSPFAAALRRHRDRRGLTQRQLADAAGLTATQVARLERGERSPGFETACRLADALDVSVARFREKR